MRRSEQRRDAVFALYQHDVTGRPLDELTATARPFTRELVDGVVEHREQIDAEIAARARGWDIDRLARLDRNLLRVALEEIHHRDDIPAEVSIDEAVTLAKEFCGADAPGFVNGILGASAKEAMTSE